MLFIGAGSMLALALALGSCASAAEPNANAPNANGVQDVPIDHGNADGLVTAGRAALERQDYGSAITLLAQAQEIRPDDVALMSDLGIAYAAKGEYSRGHQQLTGIMRLMAECADMCPQRQAIMAAFKRLEGNLGVPR